MDDSVTENKNLKLMLVIIQPKDADEVVDNLLRSDFRVTRISSTGGFLRQDMVTLLLGVEEERAFIAKAKAQGNLILLAILEGELVGWVSLFRARHEFRRHTGQMGISVIRGYRGIGIGTVLMHYALDWAAEQGLEKINLGVRASNERARALYRKFGFVEEGYRVREIKDQHGCYHDSVDMACFVAAGPVPDKQG